MPNWTLMNCLPLRYIDANPDKTEVDPDELIKTMRKIDFSKQMDNLFDTFVKLTRIKKEIEIRWPRQQHHSRFKAYTIGVLFQIAREHQNTHVAFDRCF